MNKHRGVCLAPFYTYFPRSDLIGHAFLIISSMKRRGCFFSSLNCSAQMRAFHNHAFILMMTIVCLPELFTMLLSQYNDRRVLNPAPLETFVRPL